jgi:DUF4097 and DUF4098 domain-containing protein YvlB
VIENMRGNSRVTGSETADVRVTGRKTVRAMSREEADRAESQVRFDVVREGDTVFIRQVGSRGEADNLFVSTDLDIAVPRGARIEARGRRGDFDITDVSGDVDIHSDNAGVRLQSIGGSVRLELNASDIVRAVGVKGGVELKGSGQDVEMDDVSGQVVVSGNYFGDLRFRSVAKPVRFEGGLKSRGTDWRVESCPGQIVMSRGNLSLDNVTGPVSIAATSKDVQISEFTQSLDLKVERGDLEVRATRIPVPRMTVSTNAGDIELTLPENGKFTLKATVDKGEVENEFGPALQVQEEGRGGTITGSVGAGPEVTVHSERGSVQIRRGAVGEPVPALAPRPPKMPIPPGAERSLVIERN